MSRFILLLVGSAAAARPTAPSATLRQDLERQTAALVVQSADIHFTRRLTASEAWALADSDSVSVPVERAGQAPMMLRLPLIFEAPKDLVLRGASSGDAGPDLRVEIDRSSTGRVVYTVHRAGSRDTLYYAVVERANADRFHVISRGADGVRGADGSSGRDGLSGTPGTSAMCPSFSGGDGGRGEDGGAGTDGGEGGPGGTGGNVSIEVMRQATSADLVALARKTVLSQGGNGGPGGFGGRGGNGGSGGSAGLGTTCIDASGGVSMLSGGSMGSNGLDGTSGASGIGGSAGVAGRLVIVP